MNERIPALKREAEIPRRRGGKLLALVILLFAIVLVVLFFRSPLSKVNDIHVTGTNHLSEAEVKNALGIQPGNSFFVPSSSKLGERIRKLKPVKDVKVLKKFPGKWEIQVTEFSEVATEITADGSIWAVLGNGLALPVKDKVLPDRPILTGWKQGDAVRKSLCAVLGNMPEALVADLSEITPDPSKAYPDRIRLFTRSRFEVVTTVGKLQEKIPYLSDIVQNREPGRVVMLEADTYMPYSAETAPGAP
jgi:cell division protein FtsQ